MDSGGILLGGFLMVIVAVAIGSAIISAAPAIAVGLTCWIVLKLLCNWYDNGSDDDKPP